VKFRSLKTAFIFLSLGLSATTALAAPFFQDSFESNGLRTTNSTGFSWAGANDTGVAPIGHEGQYSLRFNYLAGDSWAEQRFAFGTAAYKDLWIKFWIRVPTNFVHGSMNNKLFAIWMDDYSTKGDGPTVVWESWGNGSGGSNLAVHYSEGAHTAGGRHVQLKPFIAVPGDRGKWMEIVLHVKAATRRATPINITSTPYLISDGVIQFWRRWEGQSTFEKLHEITNANIAPSSAGPQGWNKGYFMGWANSAFSSNTEWFVDQVVMSTESLLGQTSTPTTSSPPSAPVLKIN
jgi:hypothetical protein